MKINSELLIKYNLAPLNELKNHHGDTFETEKLFYQNFLIQTDHIPNKIIEKLLEDLAIASITDFISIFLKLIVQLRTEYKEVLELRKFAREEINRLDELINQFR